MSSPVTQKTISRDPATPLSTNVHLLNWVEKMANLTKPAAIHWVDGSVEEDEMLKAQMVESGTFTKLNEELWPGCYYARSHPSDVARVEDRTYICSLSKDAAGPTNNWEEPYAMRRKLKELFDHVVSGLLPERGICGRALHNVCWCPMNLLVQPQAFLFDVLQDSNREGKFVNAIQRQSRVAIDGDCLSAFDMNHGETNCSLCATGDDL